jgi:CRP-like cAMP-binding protein
MSAARHDPAVALNLELAELARGLEHPSFSVRRTAARLLALHGDAAVALAARQLNSERPEVVEAAIQTLGAIRTRKARRILRDYLRPLYRQARLNLAGIQALQHLAAIPVSANARDDLAEGLADSNRRILRKVLAVKSALGNRRDINLLHSLAQTPEPRVRSDAVEALASLPTGRFIRPVLPLLGFGPDCMKDNPTPSRAHRAKPADPALAVRKAAKADRWLRVLAERVFGDDEGRARKKEDGLMLNLVLFLKSVPLFRALSFEDIARVANMTETVSVAEGEVLFRSGEPVTHIHVVRSGSIELVRNGMIVDILKSGMSIGEYAIFGHPQHEVSAEASADCLLLRFPVGLLADIVAEHPHSLGPIAGDLIRRVHLLYTYLAEMRKIPAQDPPVAPLAAATGASSIDRIVMA